ncbi:toxin-antitoxin system YwqK family antitoxin [Pedobacter caeni]|uniref:MORN repeat variant n=1 Tax=Pedobacter caeni TaxID=288992 RepID=A0A1M5A5T7_9SPHI|nr:hypothetical protein [Pedobacter caeni]SHF25620.1 hypothetical protein SAMN04488522_102600 [Pedobacter caeni]
MIRVNENDPDLEYAGIDAGGGNMYNYKGEPFTGAIVDLYPNGDLRGLAEFRNGYTDGMQADYYANGQVKEQYYTKYNRMYDSYKFWAESGKLLIHVEHDKNGEVISRFIDKEKSI